MDIEQLLFIINGRLRRLSEAIGEVKDMYPVVFKGSVTDVESLPKSPKAGDMYNIAAKSQYGEAGQNVAWTGTEWDPMGATIDMSLYLSREDAQKAYQPKGDYPTKTEVEQGYQPKGEYLTVQTAQEEYQPKGDYLEKEEAAETYQPKGNYQPAGNYLETTDIADWAKAPQKPSYDASEVGALPDTTKIPTKTSDLQNDSGYLSSLPLDDFLDRYMEMNRPDTTYTVKFPLWGTSQTCAGEKLDDNAGMVCEPSTNTVRGRDDYASHQEWKVWDVNARIDDNGVRTITAMQGEEKFKRTKKNDVFVAGMSYFEKTWIENGYRFYSRCYRKKPGYSLCQAARNRDGSMAQVALYPKYIASLIDGVPYSCAGEIPWRNGPSYNAGVTYAKKKGKFYSAALLADYLHITTTFWLKYATMNSQSVMAGCTSYSNQCKVASVESGVKRVLLTKNQAAGFVVGSYVSIGDPGDNTNLDRNYSYMHNIADTVKILSIETVDETISAVNLDVPNNLEITAGTYITAMSWRTGSTDDVLGYDGSPYSNTDGRNPYKIQGIEMFLGGYEVPGNAIMDIVTPEGGEPQREVYLTNDASLITTDVAKIKQFYTKLAETIPYTAASWKYITEIFIDLINGAIIPTAAGQSGSGSSAGFADALYTDTAMSGQRECLVLGSLWSGAVCGLLCLAASYALSDAWWYILLRVSINGTGGEYAEA